MAQRPSEGAPLMRKRTIMTDHYRVRALRLLTEDARLGRPAQRLFEALVGATPVARRGDATMVPMCNLIATVRADAGDEVQHSETAQDTLAALDEIDSAYWGMPSIEGSDIGSFLNGYTSSEASGLLHFQIDSDLLAVVDDIRRQLKGNAGKPPDINR